ncbi:dynein light chain roadblock [Anaeramoeba ignava]|uniref:Dynein light chain roadblock n=1 Tax=Anaeramoeba ignava TaxID=1746090 RepID=A0A9Q0LB32_ANAIG|nr:dynein light chain roadblock [Anaeramoeba ignava]
MNENTTTKNVEETIKRISSQKGFIGLLILNHSGAVIRTTFEEEQAQIYGTFINRFLFHTKESLTELKTDEELTFLRLRTRKQDFLIVPEFQYTMVVVQDPNSESIL